jgi:peptide/nickel transport system ATP-binding protein
VRLSGEPASPLAVPTGCSFHPRCAERLDKCSAEEPVLYAIDGAPGRVASCFLTQSAPERVAAR